MEGNMVPESQSGGALAARDPSLETPAENRAYLPEIPSLPTEPGKLRNTGSGEAASSRSLRYGLGDPVIVLFRTFHPCSDNALCAKGAEELWYANSEKRNGTVLQGKKIPTFKLRRARKGSKYLGLEFYLL